MLQAGTNISISPEWSVFPDPVTYITWSAIQAYCESIPTILAYIQHTIACTVHTRYIALRASVVGSHTPLLHLGYFGFLRPECLAAYIAYAPISHGTLMCLLMCTFRHFTDATNNPHHLCLVTYHLPPGFVPTVKSHGNSKKGTPFHPTWFSTKQQLKGKCGTQGPKSVVASLSAAAGGILEASAPGQLPRGEKQVVNFKSKA